jgi:glycosyltransferase involved in cell wall biosynthesis
VVLGVDGQARKLLEDAQAGIFIEPENATALTQAILQLWQNGEMRVSLGNNGRRYIVEHCSRRENALEYLNLLEAVACRRGATRSATA